MERETVLYPCVEESTIRGEKKTLPNFCFTERRGYKKIGAESRDRKFSVH